MNSLKLIFLPSLRVVIQPILGAEWNECTEQEEFHCLSFLFASKLAQDWTGQHWLSQLSGLQNHTDKTEQLFWTLGFQTTHRECAQGTEKITPTDTYLTQ